jgi:hypothetical protein
MALFYFHIEDGKPISDPQAEDLPDAAAAREHAAIVARELSANHPDGGEWKVIAKDRNGREVAVIPFNWRDHE